MQVRNLDGSFVQQETKDLRALPPEMFYKYADSPQAFDSADKPVDLPTFQQRTGQQVGLPEAQTNFSAIQTRERPAAPGQQPQQDPVTSFNMTLLDMLKQAQGSSDNVGLFQQQRALERSALQRGSQATPEELRVLSPEQQRAIRGGSMQALEPEIDAVASQIKARDSRLQNFERMLDSVKDLGGEIMKNISPSKEILDGYKNLLKAGGDISSIPVEVRGKVLSTLSGEDWQSIEQKKAQKDQKFDWTVIGEEIDDFGNVRKIYGPVDLSTGKVGNGGVQPFSGDGGFPTNIPQSTGTPDLQLLVQSIGQFESGGNYKAIGKPTAKGDRAYGKYQVMGANIPSWTKTVLGRSMTPQEFLNNPQAQDAVAQHYLGQALNNYGTIEDAASIWFSGRPMNKAGNAKDVNGTSVPTYIKNIQALYAKFGGGEDSGRQTPASIAKEIMAPNSGLTINNIPQKQRAAVQAELNKLKEEAIQSGNIYGVIKASAGGEKPGDKFVESFEKALNVVGQISDLQKVIDEQATGPIIGIIRSNNPYDTKAQQIKAQLTSIVPNLARGVYGEVGVLTDADIRTYAQTLPNLRTTEDVRNAILGMTIKSVQRSLENKIKTQAGFGRDVSGIANTYREVEQLANELLRINPQGGAVSAGIVKQKPSTSVTTPDGKTFNFPTIAAAEQFKQQAGIK